MRLLFILLFPAIIYSQFYGTISGNLLDAENNKAILQAIVSVENSTLKTSTNHNGYFKIAETPFGKGVLLVHASGYKLLRIPFNLADAHLELNEILMEFDYRQEFTENLIALTENDFDDSENGSDVTSGLLQATRDIFYRRAAFDFGSAFFKIKGYDSREAEILIDGILMNKYYDGRAQWNNWGGLNRVTNNQEFTAGLLANNFSFGGLAGVTNIITRASDYRPGLHLTFSGSNRSYNGRVMAVYTAHKQKWSYTLAGSRRWGKEGFINGTPYDAYSGFLSLLYKLNPKQNLTLTAIFASNKKGKSAALTQEVFDLAGQKYNPYWGYQNGKIRNSRMRHIQEPLIILGHNYQSSKLQWQTRLALQSGKIGNGRLINSNSGSADPVYYRYLPSYFINAFTEPDFENARLAREQFLNNKQIDWNGLYQANNRIGGEGESVYIISEDRIDDTSIKAFSAVNLKLHSKINLDMGVRYHKINSENYALIDDLLGGNFYRDIDSFTNTANDSENNPEKKVEEKHSYYYKISSSLFKGFAQLKINTQHINGYITANFSQTSYHRDGQFNNTLYSNSFGISENLSYSNFGFKAGLERTFYKNHHLSLNAIYTQRAPSPRMAFVNARVSNDLIEEVQSEQIQGAELNYHLTLKKLKSRFTAYYTRFENGSETSFFYADFSDIDNQNDDFFAEHLIGTEKLHLGFEWGTQYYASSSVTLSFVASQGIFKYTNNDARLLLYADDPSNLSGDTRIRDEGLVALKDYKISSGPQGGWSFGVSYQGASRWWLTATANYLTHRYIDIAPLLRTEQFLINPDDPQGGAFADATPDAVEELLKQERLSDIYLLNLVGGKSWRLKNRFVSLFISVSNLFETSFKTGGYEQSRAANFRQLSDDRELDRPSFGPRFWHGPGRTWFVNLSVSL